MSYPESGVFEPIRALLVHSPAMLPAILFVKLVEAFRPQTSLHPARSLVYLQLHHFVSQLPLRTCIIATRVVSSCLSFFCLLVPSSISGGPSLRVKKLILVHGHVTANRIGATSSSPIRSSPPRILCDKSRFITLYVQNHVAHITRKEKSSHRVGF